MKCEVCEDLYTTTWADPYCPRHRFILNKKYEEEKRTENKQILDNNR